MSQVVTELVIDADTSGADRFSQAMDKAAASTEGINSSISGTLLAIAGIGGGMIAAVVAVRGVIDQVVSANKELADMQSMAERVGVSLKDLQGIKFGGAIAGLSDSDINSGLEKSASLLNDAQRNANTLSKAFDANGLSIRNSNGQLITENQLLQNAADLVRRAQTPQDQIAIAQMLGFTKDWVPLLKQGAGAIAGLGEEAQQAGAIIDDETIKRAADFDAEWRKSSVEFQTNMKAALSSLLPLMDDLLERASKFIGSFDSNAIQQASDESFKQFQDATGIPDSGGIRINTDNLLEALQVWLQAPAFSPDTWRELGRAFSSGIQLLGPDDVKWLQGIESAISDTSPQALLAGASTQNFWNAQLASLKGMSANVSGVGGSTKIPGRDDDSKDAVDRAIDSLRKHTEQQIADAQAVGLGDAALARFRATAAETAAVQANGGEETAEQVKQFAALKDSAAAAADALARAKVSSQIDFNNKTMFLSQDDVAIANQLKGIYGNDVPAALASSEASALRLNTAFRGLSSSIESDLVNGLTDIVSGAKSASQGFADLEAAVVKSIEQMIIKITIVEPLMRALQSTFSGFSGVFGFASGGIPGAVGPTSVNGAPLVSSALGNVFSAGQVTPFAGGGIPDIVASPTIAPMALFGEKGEEGILPLRRDSGGRLGVSASGASGSTNVIINNHTDAQPTVQRAPNGDVTVTLRKTMDAASADSLSTGASRRVLNQKFGIKPFTGR